MIEKFRTHSYSKNFSVVIFAPSSFYFIFLDGKEFSISPAPHLFSCELRSGRQAKSSQKWQNLTDGKQRFSNLVDTPFVIERGDIELWRSFIQWFLTSDLFHNICFEIWNIRTFNPITQQSIVSILCSSHKKTEFPNVLHNTTILSKVYEITTEYQSVRLSKSFSSTASTQYSILSWSNLFFAATFQSEFLLPRVFTLLYWMFWIDSHLGIVIEKFRTHSYSKKRNQAFKILRWAWKFS